MKTPLLLVFFFGAVSSTPVDTCASNASLPEVEIEGCEVPPCTFYISSTGVMTMKFTSPRYLEHITPQAQAYLGNFSPITYPLDQKDACDGVTNTPCPLAEGEYIEYTFGMYIYPIFPEINLILEFSLLDQDRNLEPFACFKVNLQISKRTTKL